MAGKNKQKVIILLGSPGSGKGTQGELLSEKMNLYYFETSKILEDKFTRKETAGKNWIKIDGKTYHFKKEKELWENGLLCSPPFVTFLVMEKIKELFKAGKSLILSGSPRTLYEGERLIPFLKKFYKRENIEVILLEQSAETSIFRNSHRRICRLMRHPILYNKETARLKKCPIDGSELMKRKGLDNPETIKVRLKEYKERTFPLVELFKKEKLRMKRINGEKPPADVFRNILKALK
jgi:adenylate kinase